MADKVITARIELEKPCTVEVGGVMPKKTGDKLTYRQQGMSHWSPGEVTKVEGGVFHLKRT